MSFKSSTKQFYERPEASVLLIETETGIMDTSPTEGFEDDGSENDW